MAPRMSWAYGPVIPDPGSSPGQAPIQDPVPHHHWIAGQARNDKPAARNDKPAARNDKPAARNDKTM